jgi:cytoplasmic iron level regulating protein YaaA (DUF328/UPF0246 family)
MTIVLLPPSESKLTPNSGPALDITKLAFPELSAHRERLIHALIKLSSGSKSKAREVLDISAKQDFELIRNQNLLTSPAAPAWQIYTGVLYDALDVATLAPKVRKQLAAMTYVQSALFGLSSLEDVIPAYRLSGDCQLPKVGTLAKLWAKDCAAILEKRNELIIDFRSGMYTKLGPLPIAGESVVPKILQLMPAGPPKVVSHHNKATKGRILRAIAQAKSPIRNIDDLAQVILSLGAEVNIQQNANKAGSTVMEVVVAAL